MSATQCQRPRLAPFRCEPTRILSRRLILLAQLRLRPPQNVSLGYDGFKQSAISFSSIAPVLISRQSGSVISTVVAPAPPHTPPSITRFLSSRPLPHRTYRGALISGKLRC